MCLALPLWQLDRIGKTFALVSFLLAPVSLGGLSGSAVLTEAMAGLIALNWLILLVWLLRTGRNPVSTAAA